ncbi:hypothetical protein [Kingella potus]|nr:hypothetical protein [Kingella potus]
MAEPHALRQLSDGIKGSLKAKCRLKTQKQPETNTHLKGLL